MSKKLKIFLALTLVATFATSGALALTNYSGVSLKKGTGTYVGGQVTKPSWGNAGLAVSTGNGAKMYMQVRKPDGVAASEPCYFTGVGSDDSVPYKTDGYGHTLGRPGYQYICRLAHRSNSTVSSTTASGGWWP